jgi:hypothetical protein
MFCPAIVMSPARGLALGLAPTKYGCTPGLDLVRSVIHGVAVLEVQAHGGGVGVTTSSPTPPLAGNDGFCGPTK